MKKSRSELEARMNALRSEKEKQINELLAEKEKLQQQIEHLQQVSLNGVIQPWWLGGRVVD